MCKSNGVSERERDSKGVRAIVVGVIGVHCAVACGARPKETRETGEGAENRQKPRHTTEDKEGSEGKEGARAPPEEARASRCRDASACCLRIVARPGRTKSQSQSQASLVSVDLAATDSVGGLVTASRSRTQDTGLEGVPYLDESVVSHPGE